MSTRSRSKKVKVVGLDDCESRVQNEIPLTGILSLLPYETLVEILSLCSTPDFCRMIQTCKAIKRITDIEERSIYRKLYHSNLAEPNNWYTITFTHPIYSPVKNGNYKFAISYDHYLPIDAVASWKYQWKMMYVGDCTETFHRVKYCMKCWEKLDSLEDRMRMNKFWLTLHPLCFASTLVSPSNVAIYQVTLKDLDGIPTDELETEGVMGNKKLAKFYSSIHLEVIAKQKHGEKYKGPRFIEAEKHEQQQQRENTVATATLLHAGIDFYSNLDNKPKGLGYVVNEGLFGNEFSHYVSGKSFKKNSGMIKRDVFSILKDYVSFVSTHGSSYPNDRLGVPYFLPAKHPGSILPTTEAITAFNHIRQTLAPNKEDVSSMFSSRNVKKIRALQNYVLHPTEANWIELSDVIRQLNMKSNANKLNEMISQSRRTTWEDLTSHISQMQITQKRSLTTNEVNKVKILTQVAAILDNTPFTPENAVDLVQASASSGGVFLLSEDDWAVDYYKSSNIIPVLKRVYRDMKNTRTRELGLLANSFANNLGTRMTSSLVLNVIPSTDDGNNQRCYKLSARNSVPYERCKKEIGEAMKLVNGGIITQSAIIATLQLQPGTCGCRGLPGSRCSASCWIGNIGNKRLFGRASGYNGFNSDGDTDNEYYSEEEDEFSDDLAQLFGMSG